MERRSQKSVYNARPVKVRLNRAMGCDGANTLPVCGTHYPTEQFSRQPFTSACAHEVNTCEQCLVEWLRESIRGKSLDDIGCPECRSPFQYHEMKAWAPQELFERYDSLLARRALSADGRFHWCLNCPSGQVNDSDHPKFVCAVCEFEQCSQHGVAWHQGETCAQYDERPKQRDEEETRQTIHNTTQKCPQCKTKIEKDGGCIHMTCKVTHPRCRSVYR